MRVLHVIPSIARSAGGPSEVVRELMPELERRGINVRLITTDKGATEEDMDVLDQENVVVAKSLMARWTFAPGMVPDLWREIGSTHIVHVHSVHTFSSTVAMLIARIRHKPVILQPHGALNQYHIAQRRKLKVGYLRLIDGIGLGAVHSALYSSRIEVIDGSKVLPRIPAKLLPLGIDRRILEIEHVQTDRPQVLFLARLARKKRVDLLLEALASPMLADADLDAIIAGPIDGDLDYDPVSVIEKFHEKRARLVGQVGPEARATLLSSASIYVLPSDDESFGMSVAEAMGAGCAVICSPYVGVAKDAEHAGAVVIADQSAAGLAQSIHHLLSSPEDRETLGHRARRYARDNLTWTNIGEKLVGYYKSTVEAV
ncbi:Spore coat protein SA [Microbacterium laevaniformans]|uniref:Spore coat protein SA n=1 Tax=Microbacterium laevaniformans TaxID=36807 RepID=A0A150HFL6_9MICO|nr:glycosyltransferase [Microbacterium laevaniformans]KXZ60588.1 Spore coat protein SA [Microbacterium laevaniformans]